MSYKKNFFNNVKNMDKNIEKSWQNEEREEVGAVAQQEEKSLTTRKQILMGEGKKGVVGERRRKKDLLETEEEENKNTDGKSKFLGVRRLAPSGGAGHSRTEVPEL